ncbi:YcnI family protein [Streptomyces sp. NPDC018584]|uniref:YcnI family copper-binding membrane protein n=1 Tax=unclassified Streptomyces TaxID=2593676 RepID=UPI00379B3296
MFRTSTRLAAASAGALAVVCAAALPASAHVTVKDPAQATVGSFPTLTFVVPNERTEASTKKLQIFLPKESASKLTNALVKRTPGWKHTIEKSGSGGNPGENVVSVTWTARSSATSIHAGEFEEFKMMVGRIPDTEKIYFDTIQTYTSGEVVRWTERPTPENPNPAHPAPSLKVVKPSASTASTTQTVSLAGSTAQSGDSGGSLTGSPALASASAAALLAGAGGLMWKRRRSQRAADVSVNG